MDAVAGDMRGGPRRALPQYTAASSDQLPLDDALLLPSEVTHEGEAAAVRERDEHDHGAGRVAGKQRTQSASPGAAVAIAAMFVLAAALKRTRNPRHPRDMSEARVAKLAPAVFAVAAIYAVCTAIAFSAAASHRLVATSIAFDLTVTSTAAFWLFAVRPGHVQRKSLIRVAAIGFVFAKLLVGLGALGMVGALAELVVLVWLAIRIRRIVRRTRELRRLGHGLHASLDTAFSETLRPRALSSALATEVCAAMLAVTGWFRRAPAGYSMHRNTGFMMMFGVLCALAIVETVGVHLVVMQWSATAALVITILSAYGLLWMFGMAHAVRLSPLRFLGEDLVIERGFQSRLVVPRALIADATPVATKVDGALDLAYFDPNVLLVFREPIAVHGLFGRTKTADRVTISVDDRDRFLAALSTDRGRA